MVDLLPYRLDARFRPGNEYVLRLDGPTGWLDDYVFTATLGGQALAVTEDSDELVITISDTITTDLATPEWSDFLLTEAAAGEVMVGRWEPSLGGTLSPESEIPVVLGTLEVDVTLVLGPAGTGGGGGGAVDSVNGETGTVVLTASEIGSTATGDVSATTVQDAIAELASEKATAVALAAEAALARNADNLTSGTVAEARVHSSIARDAEVTAAVDAEATLARNADNLTSGTVADARIASTITRDSEAAAAYAPIAEPIAAAHIIDGTAAHAASAISIADAAGDFTATDVEGALAELQAFDEAIPALAAGVRTSIDNTGLPAEVSTDVTLSAGISGGDTLTGGTGASEILTLASTSHATRGTINVRDQCLIITESKTPTGAPFRVFETLNTTEITLSNGTASQNTIVAWRFGPTVIYTATAATFSSQVFSNAMTIKNDTGAARTITAGASFNTAPTFEADDAAVTFSGYSGLLDAAVVGVTGAGTATVTALTTARSGLVVNTGGTVTTRRGFWFLDSTGAGAVTTAVGVEIAALSDAATSIGIRNAAQLRQTAPATFGADAAATYGIHLQATTGDAGSIHLAEVTTTPTDPASGAGVVMYHKANLFVLAYNDAGTMRYKYLDMTGTGVTWVHTTTAP